MHGAGRVGCRADAGLGGCPGAPTAQAALDEQLRDAAWDDDVASGPSAGRRGRRRQRRRTRPSSRPTSIATSEGYLDLLRLTLRNGRGVDDKDSWNGTGLIRAAERGHYLVVGRLLQAGIDRDHVNRIGYQAIHEAVWLGEDTGDYAGDRAGARGRWRRARPAVAREGLTPLQMARERGYERLESVLSRGPPRQPSADPDAALLPPPKGDADAVALALRAGAGLEARDARRRTALLLASTHDHVDVARVLVALGADPDALDDRHDTPWLVTGVTGSVAMLEALLPAHPDLAIVNRYGGVSVIPASERGHVDYVRRVVATGIDVDHVNRLGWTALLEAVILGDGGRDTRRSCGSCSTPAPTRHRRRDGVTALEHAERSGYDGDGADPARARLREVVVEAASGELDGEGSGARMPLRSSTVRACGCGSSTGADGPRRGVGGPA